MNKNREPKFKIGTKFIRRGRKNKQVETIIDIIKWVNNAGDVVGVRYVCQHEFLGQFINDIDVVETTIAMGKIIGDSK